MVNFFIKGILEIYCVFRKCLVLRINILKIFGICFLGYIGCD